MLRCTAVHLYFYVEMHCSASFLLLVSDLGLKPCNLLQYFSNAKKYNPPLLILLSEFSKWRDFQSLVKQTSALSVQSGLVFAKVYKKIKLR